MKQGCSLCHTPGLAPLTKPCQHGKVLFLTALDNCMYATSSQLIQYVDARLVGDLCADNGARVTPTGIQTDPNVLAALSAGTGTINLAALIGNRYTVEQLEALTGDDAAILVMLNSWLALGILCERRGRDPEEHPGYKEAKDILNRIEEGDKMFNIPQQAVPSENFMSAVQYGQLGLIRDRTPMFFPVRRRQTTVGP